MKLCHSVAFVIDFAWDFGHTLWIFFKHNMFSLVFFEYWFWSFPPHCWKPLIFENSVSKFNSFSWIVFLLFPFLFNSEFWNYGWEGANGFFNRKQLHRMTIVKQGGLILMTTSWHLFGSIWNDAGSWAIDPFLKQGRGFTGSSFAKGGEQL